jgi:hypothetical protein
VFQIKGAGDYRDEWRIVHNRAAARRNLLKKGRISRASQYPVIKQGCGKCHSLLAHDRGYLGTGTIVQGGTIDPGGCASEQSAVNR